jgi:hypothetical protein
LAFEVIGFGNVTVMLASSHARDLRAVTHRRMKAPTLTLQGGVTNEPSVCWIGDEVGTL